MRIRLDKYLADMGCGTRSQVKREIAKGGAESDQAGGEDRHREGYCSF